ncbi:helix-turn-helix domain-containing protein [Rhizobium halophytocola]|uniref:AraC-like DNA-binding protein n=1 Tax=Rhizobium halophytocola TaxID=735519 RepID=A0ABS4E6K2_9HYPH|nr:helix-turn-helix domain-containing protein [Rhizobium halophytocola]MBP1853585.1 AraC-like DNA-binding protein [Rhizobium halophytocola]
MSNEAEYNPWQPLQCFDPPTGRMQPKQSAPVGPDFDTSCFPPDEQFERFANQLLPIAELRRPRGKDDRQGHSGSLHGFDIGHSRVLIGSTEEVCLVRTKQDVVRLDMDHWVLWHNLEGISHIETNGSTKRVGQGQMALVSMERPFEATYTQSRTAYFFMPRALFPGLEFVMDHFALDPESPPPFHPLLAEYIQTLTRMLPRMTDDEKISAENATVAMMRASLSGSRDSIADARLPILAAQFERAKRFIDANLASRHLTIDSLQAALGISRSQLYAVFERSGGVARVIRQRRLQACFRALEQEGETRPIHQIAEAFGFTNPANFSRLFRAEFDCTGEDIRRAAEASRAAPSYGAWLRKQDLEP